MNVGSLIKNGLSSLNLPVSANVYDGTAESYITYNYSDERPVVYADDIDIYDETTVQVHYFTRSNPETKKKAIRRLLRASGFTILPTVQLYESDTKYHHVIVEAWIDGVIED